MNASGTGLKRVLGPIQLWAIAVGLVISGEYFGWNFGLAAGGPGGMVLATLFVTVMYVAFIFSFTELTTAIPQAGGPYAYARRALGPFFGYLAGLATLMEFVFAPPAIALAIGSYFHFLNPALSVVPVAVAAFAVFVTLNIVGMREAAIFELFVTFIAVFELLVFFGITAPHIKREYLVTDPLLAFGWGGAFAALPFAIWFFLAIEGVAMVAEETRDPVRDIPKGYIAGILTLVILSLCTLICATGVVPWQQLGNSTVNHPLPMAMAAALSKDHPLTHMLVGVGIFGLVASFHGIIMGYSRQVFALARVGYLPDFLSALHRRFRTPHWAIALPAMVGIAAVLTKLTDQIIVVSAIGAIVLYILAMISLFALRVREPSLSRPFRAPLYPVAPGMALAMAAVCLISVCWFNPRAAQLAGILFLAGMAYYILYARFRFSEGKNVEETPNAVGRQGHS